MTFKLKRFLHDERGATAIEYALILIFVTLTCVGAFIQLGSQSGGFFDVVFNQQISPNLR